MAVAFSPMFHTLLLSKLVLFWRWMTSCMRGCCHCPGVDVPAVEGCGVGAWVGFVFVFGVRLSFGRTVVVVDAGVAGLGEAVKPLGVEGERTSAVVDMAGSGVDGDRCLCCAVWVSMLVAWPASFFSAFCLSVAPFLTPLACEVEE